MNDLSLYAFRCLFSENKSPEIELNAIKLKIEEHFLRLFEEEKSVDTIEFNAFGSLIGISEIQCLYILKNDFSKRVIILIGETMPSFPSVSH